ncbi:hypothetical protein F2Q69_00034398 [Brassica cretica]|uniref:Uncharacterized protein n=1 Tax=Brassica cretica TaxID=69181 RepID=A0A8S9STM7_BRACR|nr:hypothetical protein F2Q69_00034398 [Brassica cretica]
MAGNVRWVRNGIREIASKGRRECMDLSRIDVSEVLGCYVATELWFELDRYVATEIRLELGRYVATVRTLELGRYELGRYVATEQNRRLVAT